MPEKIDLGALIASQGFKIQGEATGDNPQDWTGYSVSSAGDINGDGIDDVIVGAQFNDAGGTNAGAAYVIYGTYGNRGTLDLAALTYADGFKIVGESDYDMVKNVSSAGDVNGDDIDDLIVGAENNGAVAGAAYVIYGTYGNRGTLDLAALTYADGFKILGEAEGDLLGRSLSSAGDINGDGFDDVIVGAQLNDAGGLNAGAAYVIYGTSSSTHSALNLRDLTASQGFKIQGEADEDRTGFKVSSAGDINGDGSDDIIVGTYNNDAGGKFLGAAYVIYGTYGNRGTLDPAALTYADGFKIVGESDYDMLGKSLSSAGDINGDSIDDLLVGANGDDDGGVDAGAAYVIYGVNSHRTGNLDLANLADSEGFKIVGEGYGDMAGGSVSDAGDINGDGIDDLIVGAFGNDDGGNWAGAAYVIYGVNGNRGTLDLENLTAADGFKIVGESDYNMLGYSVSSAGDINGDSIDDLIVGVPSMQYLMIGAAYVIYGTNSETNHAPVFTSSSYSFEIVEGILDGETVGTVEATDADGDTLTYSITDGNTDVDGDGNAAFRINEQGQIIVNDSDDIDYGDAPSFDLTVSASDGALSAITHQSVKITETGSAGWTKLLGSNLDEVGNSVAVGQDGSIYIAGYTCGNLDGFVQTGGSDAYLTKIDTQGNTVWTEIVGSNTWDSAYSVKVSADNSVYIAGYTFGATLDGQPLNGGEDDGFLTKFDQDGNKAWTRLVGSTANDVAHSMTISSDGSVYLTGETHRSIDADGNSDAPNSVPQGSSDAFLTKFSSDGELIWNKQIGSTAYEQGRGIAAGSSSTIYLAGWTESSIIDGQSNNGGKDGLLAKYDLDGNLLWTRLIGSTGDEKLNALSVDLIGNVYVVGQTNSSSIDSQSTGGASDGFITKYSAGGDQLWTRIVGSVGDDGLNAVTIGHDGLVYVCGTTSSANLQQQINSGGTDAFISVFSPDGTDLGTKFFGSTGDEQGNGIAASSDGSIYMVGSTSGSMSEEVNRGGTDAFLVKVSDSGNEAPVFTSSSYSFEIVEGILDGETVGTVEATDADGDTLTYSIADGNTDVDGDGNQPFYIYSNGTIIIQDMGDIDYSAQNIFNLTISVTDGTLSASTNVEVNLAETPTSYVTLDGYTGDPVHGVDWLSSNMSVYGSSWNAPMAVSLTGSNWWLNSLNLQGDGAISLVDVDDGQYRSINYLTSWSAQSITIDLSTTNIANISLGSGDNTVTTGSDWFQSINTGDGDDVITVQRGRIIDAGDGDNTITVNGEGRGYGVDSILAYGEGNNTITIHNAYIGLIDAGYGSASNTIYIDGTRGFGLIWSGSGDQTITIATSGYGGSINTDGGNDVVTTGDGNIGQIQTGDGNDEITTGSGFVTSIDTGGGDDFITTSGTTSGDWVSTGIVESIIASQGNDTISVGDGGATTVDAGSGDDIIITNGGFVKFIRAGSGDDTIEIGDGFWAAGDEAPSAAGTVDAGSGNNRIQTASGWVDSIMAGGGDDEVLIGSGGAEQVNVSGGNNIITTTDGWVGYIDANHGDDIVTIGSGGAQTISVENGTNIVNTTSGNVGTITAFDGDDAFTIGSGGAEQINAGGGNNTITTSSGWVGTITTYGGNDVITVGSGGARTITTGGGSDTVIIYEQDDTGNGPSLGGGPGSDTLDLSHFQTGLTVKLTSGIQSENDSVWQNIAAPNANPNLPGRGWFSFLGFENLIGSSFNDTLTGSGGAWNLDNVIDGGAGDDKILGLDGNDTLIGGAGNDRLEGGLGSDTASYATSTAAVTVNLALTTVQKTGGAGNDILKGIENLTGGSGNDRLMGNSSANVLDGGAGNDILIGGSGADTLIGKDGSDTLIGGFGNDTYKLGINAFLRDTITIDEVSGSGIDVVEIAEDWSDVQTASRVTRETVLNQDGSMTNYAFIDGVTTGGAITIKGKTEFLHTIGYRGELGSDQHYATDYWAKMYYVSTSYVLDLKNSTRVASFGLAPDGSQIGVRFIQGTLKNDTVKGSGLSDLINGFGGNDQLYGNDGDDQISGGDGDDALYGGAGDDQLLGGNGNDVLDGGAGNDTVIYSGSTLGPITISLAITGAQQTYGAGIDTLIGIENIVGGRVDDHLTGNNNDNILDGAAGNDVLSGGGGNDTLIAGGGDDTMIGGTGDDTYHFNLTDIFTDNIVIDESTGSGTADVLEIFTDSRNTLDHVLTRDFVLYEDNSTVANFYFVDGQQSSNILISKGNFEYLHYQGYGRDGSYFDGWSKLYRVELNNLYIDLDNATDLGLSPNGMEINNTTIGGTNLADTIYCSGLNDTVEAYNGDNVVYGNDGRDEIYAGSGNDTLYGGNDDDLIRGGAGNDYIDGGEGSDTAIYTDRTTAGVTISLYTNASQDTGGAGLDTLINIENLIGSSYDDVLEGNAEDNEIQSLDGDDTLIGSRGSDTLDGGAGFDTLDLSSLGYDLYDRGFDTYRVTGDAARFTITDYLNNTLTTVENLESVIIGGETVSVLRFLNPDLIDVTALDIFGVGEWQDISSIAEFLSIDGSVTYEVIPLANQIDLSRFEAEEWREIKTYMADSSNNLTFTSVVGSQLNLAEDLVWLEGGYEKTVSYTLNGPKASSSSNYAKDQFIAHYTIKSVNPETPEGVWTENNNEDISIFSYNSNNTSQTDDDVKLLISRNSSRTNTETGNFNDQTSEDYYFVSEELSLSYESAGLNFNLSTTRVEEESYRYTGSNPDDWYGSSIITLNKFEFSDTQDSNNIFKLSLSGAISEDDLTVNVRTYNFSTIEIETADLVLTSNSVSFTRNEDNGWDENVDGVLSHLYAFDTNYSDAQANGLLGVSESLSTYLFPLIVEFANTVTLKNQGVQFDAGAGNDSITGGDGIDIIIGGEGSDTLAGRLGSDRLTGGDGADHFVFNSTPNSSNNLDTITDFAHGIDLIDLSKAIFTGLGTAPGILSNAAFWSGTSVTTAHDTDDRIMYNSTTGAIYYDRDGTASTYQAVQIAALENHPTNITASDFVIIG